MNEGNLLAHEPPLNLFKTTLLEDIGLAIPRIASYIEKSGLRDRKKDYLPLSISEFEDFVKSLSKEEL